MVNLSCHSPEFDAAYDVFSQGIPFPLLEEREFLRNRLRVRDEGPKSVQEQILLQDGYTLHLIVAKEGEKVVGAIYGHLISKIAPDNYAVGFVTYISVSGEYRRRGFGTRLVEEFRKRIVQDSLSLAGKQPVAVVYEIEIEGKEEIKSLVRKHSGAPLDISYFQPSLHKSSAPEPMHLWLQPLPEAACGHACTRTYSAQFVVSLVTNLLTMEYVGPDMKGFDLEHPAYTEFLRSIFGRNEVRCLPIT